MNKDKLEGWLVVLSIALVICALGWYGAANKDTGDTSSTYSNEETNYQAESLDEYKSALQEANDNIESANSCIDDASDSFNGGYFEDGMSTLDDCKKDSIPEP